MINTSCNLRCEYCFFNGHFNEIEQPLYSIKHISESFDATNINWLIVITGGEPFLYPNFIELIKLLVNKHILVISSNLRSHDIYRLDEINDKSKILVLNASYHYGNQPKESKSIIDFTDKVKYLNSIGIEVLVTIVAYPSHIHDIPFIIGVLKDKGIEKIQILSYRGIYKGKIYPKSYDIDETELINNNSIDKVYANMTLSNTNFYRHYCEAGANFYFLNKDGFIQRCSLIHNSFGNLFKGSFEIQNQLKPCTVKECIDCYLGFLSVKGKKANRIYTRLEKMRVNKW